MPCPITRNHFQALPILESGRKIAVGNVLLSLKDGVPVIELTGESVTIQSRNYIGASQLVKTENEFSYTYTITISKQ